VLFPEGTSTSGRDVLAFRPALLAPAAELGLPVRHAALAYATPPGTPPAPDSVCWWGDAAFAGHFLRLLGLPWIEARVAFGAEPIAAADRKLLATRLQRAVADRFVPLTHA
jgi:1-acyl-sn-glycerol-3-phosphate acyltransferase